jgi:hypothetical protein
LIDGVSRLLSKKIVGRRRRRVFRFAWPAQRVTINGREYLVREVLGQTQNGILVRTLDGKLTLIPTEQRQAGGKTG